MVFICEGEKDVDRLRSVGLVATTNPGGAGKWRDDFSEALRGRQVCILPDNDEPGSKHAQQVARSLGKVGALVRILNLEKLPAKGDVSDWLDAGGAAEELDRQAWNCPAFESKAKKTNAQKIRSIQADSRPKVLSPGPDRLISEFTRRTGRPHTRP